RHPGRPALRSRAGRLDPPRRPATRRRGSARPPGGRRLVRTRRLGPAPTGSGPHAVSLAEGCHLLPVVSGGRSPCAVTGGTVGARLVAAAPRVAGPAARPAVVRREPARAAAPAEPASGRGPRRRAPAPPSAPRRPPAAWQRPEPARG